MHVKKNKVKIGSLIVLSTSAIVAPILSTSCNETSTQKNSSIDRTKLSEGDAKNLSRKFVSSVNKLVNDIKFNKIQISPKFEYKYKYANNQFWNIEKITDEYFDGLPTSINELSVKNVAITYFDSPNGAIDVEVLIQNSKDENEFTYRVITINGFEKEPIGLILNRVYSEDVIKISPNWTNNEMSFAIQSNWPIEKITSDNFYNLLEPKYGIQPKLVDVIYDGSELGQLKLVYDFYYEEQLISTKMYTVSGFAKEDLVDKVNRLYWNVEIKPKRSATKYSANSLIWSSDKIISIWFDGLPQNQEDINVSVKEVVTNAVLETQGALQVVFTFSSKNGKSIEKTFEIKGFYKDPDIAAYNLILAKEAFENIKLREINMEEDEDFPGDEKEAMPDFSMSNFELKDIYDKKQDLGDIFELPNVPYVKMNYEVFCWRNWTKINEKLPAGAFKIRFNLTDTVNGKTISVMTRTYYGTHDVLGKWYEEYVLNKTFDYLIAKKENISWEKFYTSKGKGGRWDYSRDGVIAARGQQNAIWLPLPLFTIAGSGVSAAKTKVRNKKAFHVKNAQEHAIKKKEIEDVMNKKYVRRHDTIDARSEYANRNKYFKESEKVPKEIKEYEHTRLEHMELDAREMATNGNFYFVEKWTDEILSKSSLNGFGKGTHYGAKNIIKSKNSKKLANEYTKHMIESKEYLKISEFKEMEESLIKNGEVEVKLPTGDKVTISDHGALIKHFETILTSEAKHYFFVKMNYVKQMNKIEKALTRSGFGIDLAPIVEKCKVKRPFRTKKGNENKTYDWMIDTKKFEKELTKQLERKYSASATLIGIFTDILLAWITPTVVPIYQSKADLTLLADWQGYYRYTLLTDANDAKYSFGFIPPSKERLINLLTYDSENDKDPLTFESIDAGKKYARKGAIEAFRKSIISKFAFEDNDLVFDSIKYESFNGVENCLKLPNGKENGLWSSDAYWFLSNYTFKVSYKDESLSVPFQMWLGAVDQIELDTEYVISDDRDLDTPQYSSWEEVGLWTKKWNRWKSDQWWDGATWNQYLKNDKYKKLMDGYNKDEKQWQDALRNVYKKTTI